MVLPHILRQAGSGSSTILGARQALGSCAPPVGSFKQSAAPLSPGKTPQMSTHPKLIAFDLDGTLWWPEMYMLRGGAPFRRDKAGRVFDKKGEQVELMGNSLAILQELVTDPAWADTKVAYVSRTEYPEWAVPCLKTFVVADGVSMFDMSSYQEIYPGSKRQHFQVIYEQSGIPYEDMVFFDNERWNITDCATLGITCIYTPRGMTPQTWAEGLTKWQARATKFKA